MTGILESVEKNTAVIVPLVPLGGGESVPGSCAYEVHVPAYLAERLGGQVGRSVTLHTMEYLEQQAQGASMLPRTIGFASRSERKFFEVFTTVKGIGNRKALRAMAAPPGELARMIAAKDVRGLRSLPEIGQRLAETMVAELNGKLEEFVIGAAGGGAEVVEGKTTRAGAMSEAARQAEDALVRLGESRAAATELVRRALGDGASGSADEILAAAVSMRG
ncbi:MAG TPA: Holliday junction branch migration protein RuvA [Phycisphaerales bacterium]|nr:Holliday junction branch migration protein RuvA [Phycisphaerales bacterium]